MSYHRCIQTIKHINDFLKKKDQHVPIPLAYTSWYKHSNTPCACPARIKGLDCPHIFYWNARTGTCRYIRSSPTPRLVPGLLSCRAAQPPINPSAFPSASDLSYVGCPFSLLSRFLCIHECVMQYWPPLTLRLVDSERFQYMAQFFF